MAPREGSSVPSMDHVGRAYVAERGSAYEDKGLARKCLGVSYRRPDSLFQRADAVLLSIHEDNLIRDNTSLQTEFPCR